MKNLLSLALLSLLLAACADNNGLDDLTDAVEEVTPALIEEYGFILNNFDVVRDTVHPGDTFGGILNEHGVSQSKIFEVATTYKDSFDVRRNGSGQALCLTKFKRLDQ